MLPATVLHGDASRRLGADVFQIEIDDWMIECDIRDDAPVEQRPIVDVRDQTRDLDHGRVRVCVLDDPRIAQLERRGPGMHVRAGI